MRRPFHLALLAALSLAPLLLAADWPGWRGSTGMGTTDEKDLPLRWDARTGLNVRWKAPLPGHDGKARQDQNQSSPVVKSGKVFVTSSIWPAGVDSKEFPEHLVLCFRASDGKQLWQSKVAHGPWSRASDLRGGYTAPTPAADSERVYVVFGSSVIAALDHDGGEVWRKEVVPFQFDVAMGSSPVLYRDSVLLQLDGVNRTARIVAYDRKTGAIKWERKRPDTSFSHSTPVLAEVGGHTQLLVAASGAVQGLDPADGKEIWWCKGAGDTVSPVLGGGLVYCDSGRGGMGVCVDPTGTGDVTKTHRRWVIERVPDGFSSPVIVGRHLYRLHAPGVLHCWKLDTGEEVYTKRLEGVSTSSSPVVSGERIYAASAGRSYVVKAGDKGEVLGTSDLGDASPASPAVADGCLLLRGRKFLWCVGKKE